MTTARDVWADGMARFLEAADRSRVHQADDGERDATWGTARGPDATVKGPRPVTRCPRCMENVEAVDIVTHGDGHRAEDAAAGRVIGGAPLARRQAVGDLGIPRMTPLARVVDM